MSLPLASPLPFVSLLLLGGCGVAGVPVAPGPLPPAAPHEIVVVRVADGFEVTATAPELDIDGRPLAAPPRLLLFVDQPACDGRPAASGPAGSPLRWRTDSERTVSLRLAAARAGRQGAASAAVSVAWSPPPVAPARPIAFVDAAGRVQLIWLPPQSPMVRILRDGKPVATAPAKAAMYTDTPGRGRHQYTLESVGDGYRSAPSPTAVVEVR